MCMNRDLQKDIQFYIIYKNEMLGSCHNVQQEEIGERKCISSKLKPLKITLYYNTYWVGEIFMIVSFYSCWGQSGGTE